MTQLPSSPPPIDAEEVPFDVPPPRRSAEPAVGFPSTTRPAPQLSQAIDTLRRRALQGKRNHSEQFLQAISSIRHYEWFLDEKEAEAYTSIKAALVAPGDDDELTFHLRNLVDVYNYDRATRATELCELGTPITTDQVPQSINQWEPYYRSYRLKWRPLIFDKTPHSAANRVANVRLYAPPDSFHIAEYVATSTTYDPVIYARYGSWNVEVARWD